MKKSYLYIITLILCIATLTSVSAQQRQIFDVPNPIGPTPTPAGPRTPATPTPSGPIKKGDFEDPGTNKVLKGLNAGCCNGGETIWDFSYVGPNTGQLSALLAHEASQLAVERAWNAWYDRQFSLVKEEIEKQLGQNFSNLNDAQRAFFGDLELPNIITQARSLVPRYNNKISIKEGIRVRCLKNIKLLDFRANEINSGNINNSKYKHLNLKINGKPLNDITSINQINDLRLLEVNEFTDNQWRLDQELNIQSQLNNELSNLRNINHDILSSVVNNHMYQYDHIGYDIDKLDLMQFFLIGQKNPSWSSLTTPKFFHQRFVGANHVEPYVWDKNPPQRSVFYPDFWRSHPLASSQIPLAIDAMNRERTRRLNEALTEVADTDFLGDAAIVGLGMRNEAYIKARPNLKKEIENYFKVNDYSTISHDCVNYLLNQYHDGNDFVVDTNLYKSAGRALFQDGSNPNRALEWKPTTNAINQGFTNFGNVLSELLKDNVNPSFEGYIIRDMFTVNGFTINSFVQNEWLGSAFYFNSTNGSFILTEFENNNGLLINRARVSQNQYINELVQGLNSELNLINETQGFLYNNPLIAIRYKNFLSENNSSSNSTILLNELGKVISEDCYSVVPTYGLVGLRMQIYYNSEKVRLKQVHPDWSESKIVNEVLLSMFQTGLDVVGLIPVFGEVADLSNGVIYFVRGDNLNAGLSFAAVVPFVGWGATGSKLAVKIVRVSNITSKVALPFIFKAGGKIGFGSKGLLRTVLNITDSAFEAHHIIPWTKFKDLPIVQAAANAGFHMNQALNGIPLKKFRKSAAEGLKGLHGNHPKYDDFVQFKIKNYIDANGSLQPEDAKKFLETKLIPELKDWIKKAEGYNGSLNDYFKFVVNPMFF